MEQFTGSFRQASSLTSFKSRICSQDFLEFIKVVSYTRRPCKAGSHLLFTLNVKVRTYSCILLYCIISC